MMRAQRSAGILLLAALLLVTGCKKKKPPVPPPQAQAPTITEPSPQTPAQQPATEPTPVQTEPAPPDSTATKPPAKPKPRNGTTHTAGKPRTPSTTTKPPANGNTTPAGPVQPPTQTARVEPPPDLGQLSASGGDDGQQRTSTTKLIDGTEANLKSLTRQLSSDEQNTVAQIRNYLNQARAALKDSDLERAHNLAVKANLLSNELVKR